MKEDEKLYSLPEMAKRLGVGESTLRHAAINGTLKAVKVGQRSWAVTLEDANDWLQHRPKRGRPSKSI